MADENEAEGSAPGDARGSSGRPAPGARRSPTSLLTWGAVGLVLLIVVVLLVVKVTGSNSPAPVAAQFVPVADSVAQSATAIPASVYNSVGITSSASAISPPRVVHGQPLLVLHGKPGVFYFGAEYCPYCAAERWAIVASLSRFGKFSNLGAMASSATDVFPGTQTLTFARATFSSRYVGLVTDEYLSDQPLPDGNGYTVLQPPTAEEQMLFRTYDSARYFPADSSGPTFPLVDIGNQTLSTGASFSPSLLAGLSRDQIANGLNDPTNPVTQAIVATSNYFSAATCAITHGRPGPVCSSRGVRAAALALHLTY